MPTIEIAPNGTGWKVTQHGLILPLATYPTKAQAEAHGRQVARQQRAEFIIKGLDGRIQARDSYGNDPFPPRG